MNARELVNAARAQGLLAPDAVVATQDTSPSWIVMTMGFCGAFLVALLGVGVLALFSWGEIFSMPGAGIAALVFSVVGIVLLRRTQALFWQQTAFSLLLAGQALWVAGTAIDWGYFQKTGLTAMLLGLLALQLVSAALTPVAWVQRLLGVAAGWTFLLLPLQTGAAHELDDLLWQSRWPGANLWLLALAWALWRATQPRWSTQRWAARANALGDGVAVALLLQPLAGWAWSWVGWGSPRFLSSNAAAPADVLLHFSIWGVIPLVLVAASAAWLLGWQWKASAYPQVRRAWPWLMLAYAALLAACWFTPLEAIVIVATVALGTGRTRLLWLALAALWLQLSNFYYLLSLSLMTKALLLAAIGACLAVALLALRLRTSANANAAPAPDATPAHPSWAALRGKGRLSAAVTLATALLAIGLVQWDVQRKEQVIAQGQKVFVALAPVDPRSLMQGDYMTLNFRLPPAVREQLDAMAKTDLSTTQHALAQLDARDVATLVRLTAANEALPSGTVSLPLRYLKGRWTLVTDAWFFPEGQGPHFASARFGEFRVLPDGRALLVGLADGAFQPIEALKTRPDPARAQ